MKNNKSQKKANYLNTIIVLIAIIILLILISIAIYIRSSGVQTTTNSQVNLDQTADPNYVKPNDYVEARNLLKSLPYSTKNFSANYLPIEKSAKVKIIVKLFTSTGQSEFERWLTQFDYNIDSITIEYLPFEVIEDYSN